MPRHDHEMLLRAFNLARSAHEGQWRSTPGLTRKLADNTPTEPYIFHPVRVASLVDGPIPKIAAVLHDIVEDTPTTVDELRSMFGRLIAETVDALTKRKPDGETEELYWARVAEHPVAAYVKVADIMDNMRDQPPGGSMLKRYRKAVSVVSKAIKARGHVSLMNVGDTSDPSYWLPIAKAQSLDYIRWFLSADSEV